MDKNSPKKDRSSQETKGFFKTERLSGEVTRREERKTQREEELIEQSHDMKKLLHKVKYYGILLLALAFAAVFVVGFYHLLTDSTQSVVQFFGFVLGSMLGSGVGYIIWKFLSHDTQP